VFDKVIACHIGQLASAVVAARRRTQKPNTAGSRPDAQIDFLAADFRRLHSSFPNGNHAHCLSGGRFRTAMAGTRCGIIAARDPPRMRTPVPRAPAEGRAAPRATARSRSATSRMPAPPGLPPRTTRNPSNRGS
jgi:hypothetical protein